MDTNNKKPIINTVKMAKSKDWNFNDIQVHSAMKVTGLILISLLCLFVLVKTMGEVKAFSTIGQAPAEPYRITVSGEGEVPGVKDISLINFSSYGKGKTAIEAQAMAAEANNKALAFLRSKGIADKDISTEGYNTYPTYDQKVKPCIVEGVDEGAVQGKIQPSVAPAPAANTTGSAEIAVSRPNITIAPIQPCNNYESVITGYETNQSIQVKVRGIDKNPALSGEIVTGLAEAGVRVGNLQNSIDNIDELKSLARRTAIADAHKEAKDIAKSLGGRLGKVVSFSENNYGYPMYEMSNMMSAKVDAAPTPEIPAGEGKVVSNVSITYEIR